jgi:hypothetical protein
MKEIQAQLNDFKMRAENAEQVAQRAERRAAEAEKRLGIEKENAAKIIVEACRQMRREVNERTASENTYSMILNDFEQHLPAGQGTVNSNVQNIHVQQTPGPSSTGVERDKADDNDMPENWGGNKTPVNVTSAWPPPRVGLFLSLRSSILNSVASRHLVFQSQSHQRDRRYRENLRRHLQPGNKAARSQIQGIHNETSQTLGLKRNWISY